MELEVISHPEEVISAGISQVREMAGRELREASSPPFFDHAHACFAGLRKGTG